MSYSPVLQTPQTRQFITQLPPPGVFTPKANYAAQPAARPAQVAVIKKKIAVLPVAPVFVMPAMPAFHIAPPAPAPVPTPSAGWAQAVGKAQQAWHAIQGKKWWVAAPIVIAAVFFCAKAMSAEIIEDAPSKAITEQTDAMRAFLPAVAASASTRAASATAAAGMPIEPKVKKTATSAEGAEQAKSRAALAAIGRQIDALAVEAAANREFIESQAQTLAALRAAQQVAVAPIKDSQLPQVIAPPPQTAVSSTYRTTAVAFGVAALAAALYLANLRFKRAAKAIPVRSAASLVATVPPAPPSTPLPTPPLYLPATEQQFMTRHSNMTTQADRTSSTPALTPLPGIAALARPWTIGAFGLKGPIRDEMQDAVGYFALQNHAMAVVVCDGVGGEPHGAKASDLAVTAVREYLQLQTTVGMPEVLRAVDAAAAALAGHAQSHGIQYGLRTTLMLAVRAAGGCCYYACIGDGGVYHLRGSDGVVTALFQPQRDSAGYLIASLGPKTAGAPLAGAIQLQPGDMLLTGTDGIWERTPDAAALATWLVQRMDNTGGDIQKSLQNSLAEFVQIQSQGRYVADDNASIGCIGTGSAPAFLGLAMAPASSTKPQEFHYA